MINSHDGSFIVMVGGSNFSKILTLNFANMELTERYQLKEEEEEEDGIFLSICFIDSFARKYNRNIMPCSNTG